MEIAVVRILVGLLQGRSVLVSCPPGRAEFLGGEVERELLGMGLQPGAVLRPRLGSLEFGTVPVAGAGDTARCIMWDEIVETKREDVE